MRSPAKASELATLGVSLVEGDLDNSTALAQLIEGCDALIHGAGAVRGNCQTDFDAVNVRGTANVLRALQIPEQPPRLLLISSLAAREPHLCWYGHSKHEGETLLNSHDPANWVIVRPPAVYGPGDVEMLPLFQAMYRGIAVVPGSPAARTSLIHVEDLVRALIACLCSEQASGRTLTLCDGHEGGYDWHEMTAIAGQLWGRRVRICPIPRWLLNSVATINSRLAGLTGRAPMLTPSKLRELRHEDWVVDNKAITAATGWTPQIGLRQGLEALQIPAL